MPKPLTITTPSDREIVVTREFEGPRDIVFLCWTRPELLRRWYGLPEWIMTVCEIDLRVGGKWRFVTKSPDGFEMGSSGIYKEIEAPKRIVNTELYDQDWTGGETLVTLRLESLGDDRTVSTVTVLYPTKEARDGAAASPMATGMEIGFKRLDKILATQQAST